MDEGQAWLHPPQFCGSLSESTSQATPLQQSSPCWQVGQLPPELEPLLEPLPELPLLPELVPEPLLDERRREV
jgi:hypothetical protein